MEVPHILTNTRAAPIVRTLVSGAFLLLIALTTDPSSTHPIMLIGAFILVFSTFYFGLRALSHLLAGFTVRPERQKQLVTASASGILTLVLLLQSIGQLTVRDVATVAIFCSLLYFYVSKFGSSHAV
jgi:hypothetical protein